MNSAWCCFFHIWYRAAMPGTASGWWKRLSKKLPAKCPLPSPLYKDAALRRILRAEPDAAFVFVGDSGEGDVETYGRIAGEFPRAVRRVFIREVTPLNDPPLRYTRAFAGVSGTCWDCRANLFTDAAQLPATLDPSATLPARHVQTAQAHRR